LSFFASSRRADSVLRSVSQVVLDSGGFSLSAKRKRAFHRLLSGFTRARHRGDRLRFLTLTSVSGSSDLLLRRHAQLLFRRIRRAFGFKPEYWSLRTNEGFGVLHIIFKGGFVPQRWISDVWRSIHGASIVDIRALRGSSRRLANYLVANYLCKQSFERMSWSWGWVFRGFCGVWRSQFASWYRIDRVSCLEAWNRLVSTFSPLLAVRYGSLSGG
jgi:hypothetical protein